MPLNVDSAESWIAEISSFKIKTGTFETEEAVDDYLNRRDNDPFDNDWAIADKQLNALTAQIASQEDRTRIQALQEIGRTRFFQSVMKQIDHSDLAAYASDDIDLIAGYLALGEDDAFVRSIMRAYDSGTFPLSAD